MVYLKISLQFHQNKEKKFKYKKQKIKISVKIMKFVLINPPYGVATGNKPNIEQKLGEFQIGLLYIASAIEKLGITVEIIDIPFLEWNLKDFEKWVNNNQPDYLW